MPPHYDVLLKNGHLIDPKNGLDGPADLAVKDGKIAAVGPQLPGTAERQADVAGLYVTPASSTSICTCTAALMPGCSPTLTTCRTESPLASIRAVLGTRIL